MGEGVLGPKAKKSQKSLLARGPKSPKKVSKKVRKSLKKKPFSDFFLTFRTLFETFFRLLGPGPGRLFSRLFGFWPRDSFSQVHGTSTLVTECTKRVLVKHSYWGSLFVLRMDKGKMIGILCRL